MFKEDGGVGTVSSSVRLARSSRGSLARVPCAARSGPPFAFGAVLRAVGRFRPVEARTRRRDTFFRAPLRVRAASFGRLTEPRAAVRFRPPRSLADRPELFRLAMLTSSGTLTV